MQEKETSMNKDQVEGKVKDIAGRVQRQAGEWTGDTESQVKGAGKQAEGKVQNAWGKAKDAANQATGKPPRRADDDSETEESANQRRSNG
jgi:uncharacterized protein YjbJ (UPF0337 family)